MSDVALLYDYFFGGRADGASRESLTVDPDLAARDAVATLNDGIDQDRARLVTHTIAALVRVSTAEMSRRREQASKRVAGSLRSMNRIHRLSLALNGLIFLTGTVFLVVALYLGWVDRLDDALVAGTLGVLDVALGLLTRPQRAVNESAMDQLQVQVAYNSFVQNLDQLGRHYDWQHTLDSLPVKGEAVAAMIHDAAASAAGEIERYAKPRPSERRQ
jgi:hypothetical protein